MGVCGVRIIAIDPGTEESAYVVYRHNRVDDKAIMPNRDIIDWLGDVDRLLFNIDRLAIEMIASYGMPVGQTTFETCVWIGRFIEAWGGPYELVYRLDVKQHICHDSRAKDSNIRQALIDRFPPTGGGATPQIGIKADQGPLYGMNEGGGYHLWSALAVAITSAETDEVKRLAA